MTLEKAKKEGATHAMRHPNGKEFAMFYKRSGTKWSYLSRTNGWMTTTMSNQGRARLEIL